LLQSGGACVCRRREVWEAAGILPPSAHVSPRNASRVPGGMAVLLFSAYVFVLPDRRRCRMWQ